MFVKFGEVVFDGYDLCVLLYFVMFEFLVVNVGLYIGYVGGFVEYWGFVFWLFLFWCRFFLLD